MKRSAKNKEGANVKMIIDKEKCVGCGRCIEYCPMHAISIVDKKACIDDARCAECANCFKVGCLNGAIINNADKLVWPRTMRSLMSDPLTICEETGVGGRGTEEMKTNDVTLRFNDRNRLGICIDLGRPNVGLCLRDLEKLTMRLAKLGVEFERANPVDYLMADRTTGKLKDEVLDEHFISCVVEFDIEADRLPELIQAFKDVEPEIDTVFSVGIISRAYSRDDIPAVDALRKYQIPFRINGKTCVGLGHK